MAGKSERRSSALPGSEEDQIQIADKNVAYHIEIRLEDYLFFASMEKGKVAETAPLLHNYALAYAFGFASASYYHGQQKPDYDQQLSGLNRQGIYIYPAIARRVTHRLMQYNTLTEFFSMKREQSLGIPNWGFIKCIRPGSVFESYILSHQELEISRRIRLGKWMSQASVNVREVPVKKARSHHTAHMINVSDLDELPINFGRLYNILPTRLVQDASWPDAIRGYRVPTSALNDLFLPESLFTRRIRQ